MSRVLLVLLLVVVLGLGLTFGYLNGQPVAFDYLFGVWEVPLAALLIATFALGVVLALGAVAVRIIGLRIELRRQRQRIREYEIELRSLRELPLTTDVGGTTSRSPGA
ncbi:LapA family protein [Sinimarinibacterium thermocellulolyticum]|uniref:LapA family protein n=1 Tax=Sinimarinibacterium thermocellulolyticum TaxID=3170016 RepID=A0ABV2A8G1_9GAMM